MITTRPAAAANAKAVMAASIMLLICVLPTITSAFSPSSLSSTSATTSKFSSPFQQKRRIPQELFMATNVDEEVTTSTSMDVVTTDGMPNVLTEVTEGNDGMDNVLDDEYKKGVAIIGFITLLNASLAPVWHVVFANGNGPPPLFLNAIVSIVALIGLLAGGPFLDANVERTSALAEAGGDDGDETAWGWNSFRGGIELGFWKGLGTTCHIYGMALTTANHGAFLLQLTTLIVPVIQGIRGERIPNQIKLAVALALAGIIAFTQDPSGAGGAVDGDAAAAALDAAQVQMGDTLVLGAAVFYSLYDIQTFYWGRKVPRTELVTIKIGFQAVLSVTLCALAAREDVMDYLQSSPDWALLIPVVLWSGLIVNALATFLQVGGMQSVGPTRAQTIFASQPLWASIMNYVFIGEIMGLQGILGGGAFLGALFLAATAEAPVPKFDDDDDNNNIDNGSGDKLASASLS